MDRLTDHILPIDPDTFLRCQLCGNLHKDICEIELRCECDDNDVPEPTKVFIVCRDKKSVCQKRIVEHPRGYYLVPWGEGLPGQFVLVCGNCPHRKGFSCTNPKLTSNGGPGLEAKQARLPIHNIMFCGPKIGCRTGRDLFPTPITWCEGNPDGRKV